LIAAGEAATALVAGEAGATDAVGLVEGFVLAVDLGGVA
jgi:hypothetical protein